MILRRCKDMTSNLIQTAQTKAVEAKKTNNTMQDYVKKMEGEIARALPSVITPERFTRMVLSAISATPDLAKCTPKSFLGAMMNAAQLGLEPNTPLGQAYILPYSNRGVLEAEFQLGYKGMIDLAYRSGEVEVIQCHVVYKNDQFECCYGLEPKLSHVPADGDKGEAIKVYAMFKTKDGGFGFEVMSMDDVRKHAAQYSKSYNSNYSPWKKNFEEMAKKTIINWAFKSLPKTGISDDMLKTLEAEMEYEREDFEAWKKHQEQQQADAFTQDGKFTPYEEVTNENNQ
jgi:recombination protein RecT